METAHQDAERACGVAWQSGINPCTVVFVLRDRDITLTCHLCLVSFTAATRTMDRAFKNPLPHVPTATRRPAATSSARATPAASVPPMVIMAEDTVGGGEAEIAEKLPEARWSVPTPMSEASERPLPPVIAFFNNKGGVGKSTSCFMTAALLSQHLGIKTLVVDADSQCNITAALERRNMPVHLDAEAIDELDMNNHLRRMYTVMNREYEERNARGVRCGPSSHFGQLFKPLMCEDRISNGKITDQMLLNTRLSVAAKIDNLVYLPGDPDNAGMWDFVFDKSYREGGVYTHLPIELSSTLRRLGQMHNVRCVLLDLSPSMGAFNRGMLQSSDYLIMPALADFWSEMGIRAVGARLHEWKTSRPVELEDTPGYQLPLLLGVLIQRVAFVAPREGSDMAGFFGLYRRLSYYPMHTPKLGIRRILEAINNGRVEVEDAAASASAPYSGSGSGGAATMVEAPCSPATTAQGATTSYFPTVGNFELPRLCVGTFNTMNDAHSQGVVFCFPEEDMQIVQFNDAAEKLSCRRENSEEKRARLVCFMQMANLIGSLFHNMRPQHRDILFMDNMRRALDGYYSSLSARLPVMCHGRVFVAPVPDSAAQDFHAQREAIQIACSQPDWQQSMAEHSINVVLPEYCMQAKHDLSWKASIADAIRMVRRGEFVQVVMPVCYQSKHVKIWKLMIVVRSPTPEGFQAFYFDPVLRSEYSMEDLLPGDTPRQGKSGTACLRIGTAYWHGCDYIEANNVAPFLVVVDAMHFILQGEPLPVGASIAIGDPDQLRVYWDATRLHPAGDHEHVAEAGAAAGAGAALNYDSDDDSVGIQRLSAKRRRRHS
ncbi:MAG: ParA family protein [Methanosarcinales archaeon]|nr:MAG: ParA family protein [Methanosarcinales archaeon]